MKCVLLILVAFLAIACSKESARKRSVAGSPGPVTLVIHGGAGTILRSSLSAEKEAEYHEKLQEALDAGFAILDKGGKSLDAVIATIKILEDSPLFNAGKGAVFTHDGHNELDASIMDGSTLMAGAVAGVRTVKNPITAAYAVMTQSEHVMLAGKGAELFAEEKGLEIVEPVYFFDSARYEQLLRIKQGEARADENSDVKKFGTVGCVALDKYGNLAAGTSTGGMTNKK